MTSVYRVMAVWMPVIVVPRSAATVAIDTFMTELSSVMRNWSPASVIKKGGGLLLAVSRSGHDAWKARQAAGAWPATLPAGRPGDQDPAAQPVWVRG